MNNVVGDTCNAGELGKSLPFTAINFLKYEVWYMTFFHCGECTNVVVKDGNHIDGRFKFHIDGCHANENTLTLFLVTLKSVV